METGDLNPAVLSPETRVGPWRIVGLQGRGAYGAVYRAMGVEPHATGLVALKLALHPRDARFAREAELLSRIRHPGVPRLRDAGEWLSPSGTPYPYLAMDFVEGEPLYVWARRQSLSSRRLLQLFSRLARALEATHAAGGVHRDVKGDNVLVRSEDTWPVLIDFGAGHHVGASTLTGPLFPPGTLAYRSPEAWGYVLRVDPDSAPPYPAGPADDVFALGVTAWRLLTEQYPPSTDPTREESYLWHEEGTGAPPARALNARCCPELSALVSQMLAVHPEARGSARELAEALERAACGAGPEADVPLFAPDAPRPLLFRAAPRPVKPRAMGRGRTRGRAAFGFRGATGGGRARGLAAVTLAGVLAFGFGWTMGPWKTEDSTREPVALRVEAKDGGVVAVGDSAVMAPEAPAEEPSVWPTVAVEVPVPPKPLPGQRRTDANGRCPAKHQVPIHGACWIKLNVTPKECEKADGYVHQGGCYMPVIRRPGSPMSSPAAAPERR